MAILRRPATLTFHRFLFILVLDSTDYTGRKVDGGLTLSPLLVHRPLIHTLWYCVCGAIV